MKALFSLILLSLFTNLSVEAVTERVEHAGCYAGWDHGQLIIGNTLVERRWSVSKGHLIPTSFFDKKTGTEWMRRSARQPAPHPGVSNETGEQTVSFSVRTGVLRAMEAESLEVKVSTSGHGRSVVWLKIYPESRGVTHRVEYEKIDQGEPEETDASSSSTGLEGKQTTTKPFELLPAIDEIVLSPRHLKFTEVSLLDQTDHRNELVFEKTWLPLQENITGAGNIFFVEDTFTGQGILVLKLAPLPHSRPIKRNLDARYVGKDRRLIILGHEYPTVLLSYEGGRAGRIAVLQDYQRCLRKYDPERDGMFLSNTWGDRSQDSRVSEEFLMREIEAGAHLGVDVVQVDDGWQKGMSGNSAFGKGAWGDFYKADPEFWNPHPKRFPNGLKPLFETAQVQGMKFGLWFGPDASDDMKHWERDADRLLDLHRNVGVEYIKIDAVEMLSPVAEKNLNRFYEKVLNESKGKVTFDADVTAGIRPGYFGIPQVGPIFVENRYTDFHRYWPHHTLRNVWKLSQYVDPVRLRMEFLNTTRNTEKYGDDPLAPDLYSPDYLFASVMFTSPLGWFETSNLPEKYFSRLPGLVATWKGERKAIFEGHIIPIGKAPDGVSWTGLCSVAKDRRSAHAVVFREFNEAENWEVPLPLLGKDVNRVTVLGGKGSAAVSEGRLEVSIPDRPSYIFLRID